MRIDLDAPTFAVPAARMDRQALEVQEDLDLVLGDLDPQLLVAVDVRGAVVVALDADSSSRRAAWRPSTPRRRHSACGSGFERRSLQRLEALAARDAKAGVAALIDALDALARAPG